MKKFSAVILAVALVMSCTTGALAKMPSGTLSVNEFEWEVLKLVNRERAKEGLDAVSMVPDLQEACNLREVEIKAQFTHKRPDGSAFYTAFPSEFQYNTCGENIAMGQTSPREVVDAWMDSPGHKANILDKDYGYMGVGFAENCWVQLFANRTPVISYTTGTGTTDYSDEASFTGDFLMCTAQGGTVSYLPLDPDSMIQSDGGYVPRLSTKNTTVLTFRVAQKPVFTDVQTGVYYDDAVAWAVGRQITTGTSATTFSPTVTCTRAEILTFLWRAVGAPETTIRNPFTDVNPVDYFYSAALWAYEMGMVTGNTFDGNTPCTRASTVTYLWLNAGSPSIEASDTFTDVPSAADYAQAVAWAVAQNVTGGTGSSTFSPDTICDRAQIVTFLMRALG